MKQWEKRGRGAEERERWRERVYAIEGSMEVRWKDGRGKKRLGPDARPPRAPPPPPPRPATGVLSTTTHQAMPVNDDCAAAEPQASASAAARRGRKKRMVWMMGWKGL